MPRRTRLKGTLRPWPAPLAIPATAGAPARHDEARLLLLTGDEHCTGPWALPRRFAVKAILGSLVLDLRQAVFPPDATLDVDAILAEVRILLPPGVLATVLVSDGAGDVKDRRPEPHRPHAGAETARLLVTGVAILASIELRGD